MARVTALLKETAFGGEHVPAAPASAELPGATRAPRPGAFQTRLEWAGRIYAFRKASRSHVPGDLIADPAGDMLLWLYISEGARTGCSQRSATSAAGVTEQASLRWQMALAAAGLIERLYDEFGNASSSIGLTRQGRHAVDQIIDSARTLLGGATLLASAS